FIDEIHSIVGAGDSDGSMNAANIMKPALSRGQMQVIGATTFAEYRKYIEKDSALERRFQPVKVEEPSLLDTIEVIKGIRIYYEKHHCVRVPDAIVTSIVKLSERYITDRFLPDKAIDLLDEACACCNLRHPEITELLEAQRAVADLETREHELENPEGQDAAIDYEALAAVKTDLAQQREKLPALQLKVAEIEVTMDDVAQVIELWTGVPAVKIKETEYGRLQGLEEALRSHIIGQDEAVHAVAGAIKRARADLSGRHRPASFIFVGPTGVGKTELVKQLANQLFDTVDPLISIDMSEYMEKYAVSRLIGSPPGYVGYDEAGQLTEKVRRHPYSVVLFDEIEKAHPDVMNILLQILDEGKINDAQGRTVDFSNTVICMTSNAGSTDQSAATGFGKTAEIASADKCRKALQEFLRPEFIGRVDEIITFRPLSESDLEKIAALMLDEYKPGLQAHSITLQYDQPALAAIVAESSARYGARELRRTIRKTVEDPVSDALVEGRLGAAPTTVTLTARDGKPVLEW
ncbi:MAG: ATP-dependent Clp protease ATP-binding subunit, partial [Gemmiger sp.]|nr:ATP-dependent Clp protease ATP-binding subunit [Gemmiger sp.]